MSNREPSPPLMDERAEALAAVEGAMTEFERLAMDVRLDAVVATQLSIQQLKVLMLAVHRAPVTAQEVAEALDVSAATVSGIVGRLVDRDLLVQETDPADRRSRHLRATRAGVDALAEISYLRVAQLRLLLSRLSDDEIASLRHALGGLARALGELLAE